jgi:hypothetical protein
MSKSSLISSASLLKQPSVNVATEFESKRELLASEMNRLMIARSDLNLLIGEGNTAMMEDNHRNHGRFISSVLTNYQPEVLVETVLWVFRAYRSHGFHLTYWPAQLDQWVELFKTHLSQEAFNEIYPFYHWMIVNQPLFVMESDKMINTNETPSHGN